MTTPPPANSVSSSPEPTVVCYDPRLGFADVWDNESDKKDDTWMDFLEDVEDENIFFSEDGSDFGSDDVSLSQSSENSREYQEGDEHLGAILLRDFSYSRIG